MGHGAGKFQQSLQCLLASWKIVEDQALSMVMLSSHIRARMLDSKLAR